MDLSDCADLLRPSIRPPMECDTGPNSFVPHGLCGSAIDRRAAWMRAFALHGPKGMNRVALVQDGLALLVKWTWRFRLCADMAEVSRRSAEFLATRPESNVLRLPKRRRA